MKCQTTATKPGKCRHKRTEDGPRYPLRYGSSATLVCKDCGAYKLLFRDGIPWEKGPLVIEEDDEV